MLCRNLFVSLAHNIVYVGAARAASDSRATLHFFVEFMICVRSRRQTLLFSEV